MNILRATDEKRDEIKFLLQSQNLPAEDLPPTLTNFYIAIEEDKVVGVIGMELYGQYGLLRSMVVHPGYRNKKIAENLVQLLEEKAALAGLTSFFLLTETAENYFKRKGYAIINRNKVPVALLASTEFSHICPASATVMQKELIKAEATAL